MILYMMYQVYMYVYMQYFEYNILAVTYGLLAVQTLHLNKCNIASFRY